MSAIKKDESHRDYRHNPYIICWFEAHINSEFPVNYYSILDYNWISLEKLFDYFMATLGFQNKVKRFAQMASRILDIQSVDINKPILGVVSKRDAIMSCHSKLITM